MTPKPTMPLAARRMAVLRRHARLSRSGRPEMCNATRDLKVIFDTRESAEAAAAELLEADPTTRRQRAYPCPQSRHGHHHLASEPQTEEGRS